MPASGWQGRLNDALCEEDVARVCREYLEVWTPAQLAEMPESCRPDAAIASEGVGPYAAKLIRQLGIGDRASAPMLYTLSSFFAKAAFRLVQIRGT